MDTTIRLERSEDYRAVEALTRDAFWNVYAPGCDEHYLAHILRDDESFIPALDFVAVRNGQLVGNIMYTHAHVLREDGTRRAVCLFGPLSVLRACQRQGIGAALIRHSTQAAARLGFGAVLLYGNPGYYGRQGFTPASAYGITPPDGVANPALQAMELAPGALVGASGRLISAPVYDTIDPEKAAAFDSAFPPREKLVLEGQLSSGGHGADVPV